MATCATFLTIPSFSTSSACAWRSTESVSCSGWNRCRSLHDGYILRRRWVQLGPLLRPPVLRKTSGQAMLEVPRRLCTSRSLRQPPQQETRIGPHVHRIKRRPSAVSADLMVVGPRGRAMPRRERSTQGRARVGRGGAGSPCVEAPRRRQARVGGEGDVMALGPWPAVAAASGSRSAQHSLQTRSGICRHCRQLQLWCNAGALNRRPSNSSIFVGQLIAHTARNFT